MEKQSHSLYSEDISADALEKIHGKTHDAIKAIESHTSLYDLMVLSVCITISLQRNKISNIIEKSVQNKSGLICD